MRAAPAGWFGHRVAIVSPHPDDETLGCGALMAQLGATREIHVLFVTDGSRSPEPPEGVEFDRSQLVAAREDEAREAMAVLGIPGRNLRFLRLPDGRLSASRDALCRTLVDALRPFQADDVLVPFRYDWHPDHLAVHQAVVRAAAAGAIASRVVEYFVYTQRRLLPRGDIRAYLRPDQAVLMPAEVQRDVKLQALECFRTQTTRYYEWQRRPILTPDLLRRMCAAPEAFVAYRAPAGDVLHRAAWVRAASAAEPRLKRLKDGLLEWVRG